MRRLVVMLPVAGFLAIAAVAGWLLAQPDRDPRIIPSPLIGRPAPAIELPPIAGFAASAGFGPADLKGETTIVNVFASWCVPCLAEHPLVTALAADGVRVFAINYRDDAAAARAWLARHGNPYARIGADPSGRQALEWGVTGVPETFVVDRAGTIRLKHAGPLTAAAIDQVVMPALEEFAR